MKNKILKYFAGLSIATVALSSCKKDYDTIFNMFDDVKVEFLNLGDASVVDYKQVNVGDSVWIDYTITSKNKSMFTVCEFETSSALPNKIVMKPDQRHSYTGRIHFVPNRVATITYRVWAQDSAGVYIGDGYKKASVDVNSDYNYYVQHRMSVPDTVEKNAKCFINLRTGALLSYNEAASNPDQVDAGIMFNPTLFTATNGDKYGGFVIYALTDPKFPLYDISGWATKRAVVFSALKTNQTSTWTNTLRTGKLLASNAGSSLPNKSVTLTTFSTSTNAQTTAANLVYFKTPEGKVGALYINYVTAHSPNKGTIMSVDVKIQK